VGGASHGSGPTTCVFASFWCHLSSPHALLTHPRSLRPAPQADAAGPSEPSAEEVGAARLAAVSHHSDAAAAAGATGAAADAGDAAAEGDADAAAEGDGVTDYSAASDEDGGGDGGGGDGADDEAEAAEGGAADAADAAAPPGGMVTRIAARVRSWLSGKSGVAAGTVLQRVSLPRHAPSHSRTHAHAPAAEAGALRSAHGRATRKLGELTARRDVLTKHLAADGGADGAYLALIGQCFELKADAYTYVMCPFDAARQEPGSTSLGSWQGWAEGAGPAAARPAFSFSGGLACWNGPARSLRVDVACGAENEVTKVEEPNRCEYRADFLTPAACGAEEAAQLALQAQQAVAAVAKAAAASKHSEL
jgi:hypothetical protein